MFHRLALAALLIGFLTFSANAQKRMPKSADLLTWETVAADPAGKMVTKRASVPGGWLVLVQSGDSMSLAFFPDAGHRWADESPSDLKAHKGKEKPKFEDITKAMADKLRADLEQARATALAERDKAEAALRRAEEERKRHLDQLDKAKKDKPRKGEKGTAAADLGAAKREAEALREQAEKQRAIAEEAREKEAAARREALLLKEKAEAVAQQFQKQLAETTKALEDARAAEKRAAVQAASAMEETKRLQVELDQARREAERLKQLLDKKKKK